MQPLSRRRVMQQGLAASLACGLSPNLPRLLAEEAAAEITDKPYVFELPAAGRIMPRPSKAIASSGLSVGFETLDRQHFDPTKTYGPLSKLGVKWARCQTGWCRCEKEKGKYTFDWLDEVVDSLLAIGVQPWFNLGYGNQLYTPRADETAVGWAPIFDEEPRRAWVNFTRAIAEHFADRVKCWEIWNEPNIRGFWKPNKPDPVDYAALVKLTAPEIRQRVPEAVIIGVASAHIPMNYIQTCFEQGMGDHIDCLSYHPYRPQPEAGYEDEINKLRKIVDAHNPKIRLWQGENGAPSKGGKGSAGALSNLNWSETRQAKWLTRRILSDLRLDIELTSYFHLVDLVGYRGITNYKGLLRGADYSPKPAFVAYQHLCALFDHDAKHDPALTLDLVGESKTHMLDAGFTRKGYALYAYWMPASLFEAWAARPIRLSLPHRADAQLQKPVLIDPLTGKAYRLDASDRTDKTLTVQAPLLEYPLLITDQSLL
ncbi:beta-glucosidase [Planctomycetales bacterium ZRK34]|nr:beta-glucosidase [Planctomycetales bacterium ZRK34]